MTIVTPTSNTEERRHELTFSPRLVYPAKRLLSRTRSVAWRLRGTGVDGRDGLRILFYHRVSDEQDRLAVRVKAFAEQMARVDAVGIAVLDLDTAVERWLVGESDERFCALTFDDGYADVMLNAIPVLERYGFTATMFIPTGAIDGTSKFNWYTGPQPTLLTWAELRQLATSGTLRFGAHTVTHPNLLMLGDDLARNEIVESKRRLEERLGMSIDSFSYPAGLYSQREVEFVRSAGYRLAVTCDPGLNTEGGDLLRLRRTQIDGSDAHLDFQAKLAGGHDRQLPLQQAFRRKRYGLPD